MKWKQKTVFISLSWLHKKTPFRWNEKVVQNMVYLNGNRLSSSKKNMEYIWYCLPKGGFFCDVVVIIKHYLLKSPTWNDSISRSAVARRKANWTSLVALNSKWKGKINVKIVSNYLPASARWHERICSIWSSFWNRCQCFSFRMDRPTSCWPWWKPSSCSCTWMNQDETTLLVYAIRIVTERIQRHKEQTLSSKRLGTDSFERRMNVHVMFYHLYVQNHIWMFQSQCSLVHNKGSHN